MKKFPVGLFGMFGLHAFEIRTASTLPVVLADRLQRARKKNHELVEA